MQFGMIKFYSRLALILALADIRNRYRRSVLGPFWITLSMGVMISSIGFVFGKIFAAPMTEFLPFLAVGLMLWGFISGTIGEGCLAFVEAEGLMKQVPLPLAVHILRILWRNLIILAHNFLILPIVLLVMGERMSLLALVAIPGLVLVSAFVSCLMLSLALVCTRYRDVPQIVSNMLQVVFYLTPIIWMPGLLNDRIGKMLLQFNPVFHMVELIRAPLLGALPSLSSWLLISIFAASGWILTLLLLRRYRKRIVYWL